MPHPAAAQAGVAPDPAKELDDARRKLRRRDAELATLRAELGVLRAVAGKVGASAERYMGSYAEPTRGLWADIDNVRLTLLRYIRRRWLIKSERDAIQDAGVFDPKWYLSRYPDVADAGFDPLVHYLRHGAGEGRDPHPLFDNNWYRSTYPEAIARGLSPLGHFAMIGAAKCCDPNPLFQTAWYVTQNPDVSAKRVNPLRHYMDHAAEPGRNPNPLFDSVWYLKQNPGVQESRENPLGHYLHKGIVAMRNPHPLFDSRWYLANHEHVAAAGIDALEHYLTVGVFEGCRLQPDPGQSVAATVPVSANLQPAERPAVPALVVVAETGTTARQDRKTSAEKSAISPTDIMRWEMKPGVGKRPVVPFNGEIGVFVHLYYEELSDEMAASLLAIPYRFKVYVSTNNQAKKSIIEAQFRRFGLQPVIKVLPNRGWDVAPFAVAFVEEMRRHELCLKLHGKLSRHSRKGFQWRKYLLSGLVGDKRNVQKVVETFMSNPDLGVLMLPHWRSVAAGAHKIGANYQHMRDLLARADLPISSDQRIEFPSGSMFWFRSKAMEPMLQLGLTWSDFYGCRPRNVDATIAHAVERSFLIFSAMAGFRWTYLANRGRWGVLTQRVRGRRPATVLVPHSDRTMH